MISLYILDDVTVLVCGVDYDCLAGETRYGYQSVSISCFYIHGYSIARGRICESYLSALKVRYLFHIIIALWKLSSMPSIIPLWSKNRK